MIGLRIEFLICSVSFSDLLEIIFYFYEFFLIFFSSYFKTAHTNDIPDELQSDKYLRFDDIHLISAKDESGIDEVKASIRTTLDKYAEIELNNNANQSEPNEKKLAKEIT